MKFVLVSTARSGSQFAVKYLAEQYNISFHYYEILHKDRMTDFWNRNGGVPVYVKNNKLFKLQCDTSDFYEIQSLAWSKSDVASCKILDYQITKSNNKIVNNILEDADHIAYLYRKDSTSQVYSAIISKKLNQYLTRVETEDKTFIDITQEDFNSQSQDLLESNLCIKEVLGKYPGKVYCLEDDFDHKPYADVYDYDKSFTYKLQNIQDLFK